MSRATAEQSLAVLVERLRNAIGERDSWNKEIAYFINSIRRVCKKNNLSLPAELQRNPAGRTGSGLTVHIRKLFASGDRLTAAEVHEALVSAGDLFVKTYRNPRSVIHNTLRRMVKQCELSIAATVPKTTYRKAG